MQNVPSGFKCFPKVFMAKMYENPYYNYRVVTYLKPQSGGNTKIAARIMWNGGTNYPEFEITSPSEGSVSEYGIAGIFTVSNGRHELYVVYKIGQTIKYRHCYFGTFGGPNFVIEPEDAVVSNDVSTSRFSPDISLRNYNNSNDPYNSSMQPVVTYQGQYVAKIIIEQEFGPPQEILATYYPIQVKERNGSNGWGGYISYNYVNVPQQYPNIEGSKLKNSCVVDFSRGTITHRQVVLRWNGGKVNSWVCVPNTYNGTDAKLIKGSLVNSSSYQNKLMTLGSGGPPFQVGQQPFEVRNYASPDDPGFEEINGIVLYDNIKYSFNLGSVFVNWNQIGFDTDIDTIITDDSGFNDCFVSRTFGLYENDTLIIGRNAFYIEGDSSGTIHQMEYWVKLMNNSTGQVHQLLAHDTIQTGDSIQIEYLEGFVITNIPNGFDSFYVALEVDTLDGSGYGIGGGVGGDDGGDNIAMRKKIFWGGKNYHPNRGTETPLTFNLNQNYPNPFNPTTTIKYTVAKDVNVSIKVYDLLGREVAVLVNSEFKKAGSYAVNWNASNFASGVYFYRIEAGDFVEAKRMVLVK